ncbi:flagellar hook-basal body complex protein FliE [Cohnella nanjingensis]|uniref:Flagellar hook-basal body complex protein FliE n=1 Tax=Cohnella nanjingensis TaxID=1387779 RepID=A0A7X0VI49_9BACL|nr:flagellar hook-basal body complex protein FliE [Cohnella nanjingensis]MBB6674591.1 flagellar hook-basal body complex protein FliE [Cohnella nanjingensis]
MIQNSLLPITGISAGALAPVQNAVKQTTPAEATESFAAFLKQAIDGVAAQEQNAHAVTDQFIVGQADVNDVMIAATKAELSLELTSQIRNKVIEAYQEIMRMQM